MSKIIISRPLTAQVEFSSKLHPVLQRIFAARDVSSETELDYSLQLLPNYQQLADMDKALELLEQALRQQQKILVVADFDADGATSCALAIRALQAMGAQHTAFIVPDRFKHGYGLTPEIVELAKPYQPDLLITVDNGIASLDGVLAAKQAGMQVLVTDHHLPGDKLPNADAIVNPNRRDDAFPCKNLAGVGVMFYVLMGLRARLRDCGWFDEQGIAQPNLAQWLDLVALGTVADVVPLDHTNRILVQQGLARMRQGHCCAGIQGLIAISSREQTHLTATDLAFYLGPRLNAAGRMENMAYGIECLLNDDADEALTQAQQLDSLNQERRIVEQEMQRDAEDLLAQMQLDTSTELPFGLCLYDSEWHAGVVGLLASRIKERFFRPVIVFTDDSARPGDLKGSARSVPGVHIRDVLDKIATLYPELLSKFGGHAMAAGLSLRQEHLEAFREIFDQEVRRLLRAEDLQGVLFSDGSLGPKDFTLDFAEQLRNLTPWGQGFPEPLFDGEFKILEKRRLKDKHLKLLLQPVGGQVPVDAIAFNQLDSDWGAQTQSLHVAYRLDVNVFRGFSNLQLRVEHIEALD